MKILYVDDEESLLEVGKLFLEQNNSKFSIQTCISAAIGLQLLKSESYDVIVSDYQMPSIDGLEFLRIIREDRDDSIPFIIFTGRGREEVAIEALNLGANRYIQKGADIKSQYIVLARAIEQENALWESHKKLFNSEEKHRTLIEAMNDGFAIADTKGNFVYANERLCKILDYSSDEIVGKGIFDFLNEENQQVAINQLSDRKKGADAAYELSWTKKGGEQVPTLVSPKPITDENGAPSGSFAVVTEISELKKAQEELVRANLEEEKVFQTVADGLQIVNTDLAIVKVNEAMLKIIGLKEEEIVGTKCSDLLKGDYCETDECSLNRILNGEKRVEYELTTSRPDGMSMVLTKIISPLTNSNGKVIGLVKTIKDITERKAAEEALYESNEWLSTTLRSIGDAVITTDCEGKITFLNPIATALTGYESEIAIGQPLKEVFKIVNEHTRKPSDNPVEQVLKEGKIVGLANHTILISKEGKEIPIYDAAAPIINNEGIIIGVVLVFQDMTERRKTDKRIERLREFQEITLNISTRQVNLHIDEIEREIVQGLEEISQYFGVDRAYIYLFSERGDMVEKHFSWQSKDAEDSPEIDNFSSKDIPWVMNQLNSQQSVIVENLDESSLEIKQEKEILQPAGIKSTLIVPMIIRGTLIGYLGFHSVIEERIWNSEEIKLLRVTGEIYSNALEKRKAEKVLKESEEKYRKLVETMNDGLAIIDAKSDFNYVNDQLCEMLGYSREELLGTSSIGYFDEQNKAKVIAELKGRKIGVEDPFEVEWRCKNGEKIYTIASPKALFDEEGNHKGSFAVITDITERVKSEESEAFLDMLLRHDVMNKAISVQAYLTIIEQTNLTDDQEKFLQKAMKMNNNSITLIEKIRKLKKLSKDVTRTTNISSLLDTVKSHYQKHIDDNEIEFDYIPVDLMVDGGAFLNELFSNLIENAIYHSECSIIKVRVKEENSKVRIIIEDNGIGVSEEIIGTIFERGTKGIKSSGSGVGLFLTHRIATTYGGDIELKKSELGGARFDVILVKST